MIKTFQEIKRILKSNREKKQILKLIEKPIKEETNQSHRTQTLIDEVNYLI